MKTKSEWMRAGVVVLMVAAATAGAQTTAETQAAMDSHTARMQADVAQQAAEQAKMAVQAAAQAEKIQAEMAPIQAKLQAEMAPMQAKLQAEMLPMQARLQVKLARLAPMQVAKLQAAMAPMQAKLQAEMLPMQARLEMSMAPLQARMMAQGVAMQAQMLAQGAIMQAGMVNVGDPQVKDDLFDGTEKFAKGASDVTSVNLGPDMLGMVSGKHGGDMAHKLNFMVVRSYEYPHAGMYNLADVDAYRQKLRSGNWNCFIHTTDSASGESTDICNRPLPNNGGNEMVIMTVEPKELTFIHMSGKGSLADLGKMGRMGGFSGGMPTPPEPPAPPAPHE